MSTYFPEPESITLAAGVQSLRIQYDDATQVLLSTIAPGATLSPHCHPEAQIGLALAGRFVMEVDGKRTTLDPLGRLYAVDPGVSHLALNPFDEPAIGLDLKRTRVDMQDHVREDIFFDLLDERKLKTGLVNSFFVGPWFEVMVTRIPPGGHMPPHQHHNEQIGIAVTGRYIMQVGDEEREFGYGQAYWAPGNVPHGAHNPFPEEACTINVFLPPRYHRFTRKATARVTAGVE